jgi:WD40 repeat protein
VQDAFSLAFTPDGQYLLVGRDRSVVAYHAATGAEAARLDTTGSFPEAAVPPEGTHLLVTETTGATGTVRCHALQMGPRFRELWSVAGGYLYGDPCFAPGGARAAVSVHESRGDRVRNHVHVLDAEAGTVTAKVAFDRDGSDPVEQVAFAADGSRVLARARSRTVKVFDAATGAPAGELVHPGRPFVTGMAVHPNGTVACSRNNGQVYFWDLEKRELVRTLDWTKLIRDEDWKAAKLMSVAFAPDGSLGAAGTEDGQVVVWDVDE